MIFQLKRSDQQSYEPGLRRHHRRQHQQNYEPTARDHQQEQQITEKLDNLI
jgi:hypothetical protein